MLKRATWLAPQPDLGLLLLRLGGAYLLLMVHGLPKLQHYAGELAQIDDPLHLGRQLTLWLALLAEVLCPLAIAIGVYPRLACVPVLVLLLVIFASIGVAGGGRYQLTGLLVPPAAAAAASADAVPVAARAHDDSAGGQHG